MKVGTRDYVVTPVPDALSESGVPVGPRVLLEVMQWGFRMGAESIEPAVAREFAAQLLTAANVAEGRA